MRVRAAGDADAVVVALKSRTIAPQLTRSRSRSPRCRWLRANGATQIYFKVCSTFDSTPRGNIGPVLEALMDELDCGFTIATPAFPDNARTVFKGHLFVGDVLLSDSGMRHHPLTPMTDANLVRVLQAQLAPARADGRTPRRVGLVDHRATGASSASIEARFAALRRRGCRSRSPTRSTTTTCCASARRCARMPLVCAGSGLAIGLPRNFGVAPSGEAASLPPVQGFCAIVSGSCSEATNAQVAEFLRTGGAARRIDPLALGAGVAKELVEEIARWAEREWASAPDRPVLVYSTAPPQAVAAAQAHAGAIDLGARLESLLAAVAAALVERGARKLVVAGGETSGACVQALGVETLAHRPADRSRRAVVPCARPRRQREACCWRSSRATSARSISSPARSSRQPEMSEAQLREELCRVGRSLHARGYVHGTTGNLSARLDDGVLVSADRRLPRRARRPKRSSRSTAPELPVAGAQRPSKTIALHVRIYAADCRGDTA